MSPSAAKRKARGGFHSPAYPSIDQLCVHDHVCLFSSFSQQISEAVALFLLGGWPNRERCLLVTGENAGAEIRQELSDRGLDVDALLSEKLFQVIDFTEYVSKGGELNLQPILERIRHIAKISLEQNCRALRIVVQPNQQLYAKQPLSRITAFESGLDHLRQEYPCILLCLYDHRYYPSHYLMDIVCAHPQVIHQGILRENSWYVPVAGSESDCEDQHLNHILNTLPCRSSDDNVLNLSTAKNDFQKSPGNKAFALFNKEQLLDTSRFPNLERQLRNIHQKVQLQFGISRFSLGKEMTPANNADLGCAVLEDGRCPHESVEKRDAQQQLLKRLHALLKVNLALTETSSVDELCRRAIELGTEQLGYDRMSIWLLTDNPDEVVGTFGMDEQGRVRDERHMRHKLSTMDSIIIAMLPERLFFLRHNTDLFDNDCQSIGKGSLAYASIWDGRKQLGYLFMDNLFSQRPMTRQDGELLALFASAVGHLCARKRTEEKLHVRDRAIESSLVAFSLTDVDQRVTYVNPKCLQMWGYSNPGEVVGHDAAEFWADPQEAARLLKEIAQKSFWSGEITARRKDGSIFETMVSANLIKDEQGKPIGVVGSVMDISERKRVERELDRHRNQLEELVERRTRQLEQSQEKVRQAERLASIGTLAARVAHEINNPVGSILLSAQIGREAQFKKDGENALVDKSFQRIMDNARRCGRIVQSILKFARQEDTEKWPHQVNDILDQALKMTNQYAQQRKASVKAYFGESLPPVQLNSLEMEQVFVNLINNAIESGPPGSVRVTVRSEQTDWGVRILVEDNGIGVHEQQRKHLFDPFFTTRQQQGGTGLGLSIAHGIVANHGGKIGVVESSDGGSTFIVELPRAPHCCAEGNHVQNTDC